MCVESRQYLHGLERELGILDHPFARRRRLAQRLQERQCVEHGRHVRTLLVEPALGGQRLTCHVGEQPRAALAGLEARAGHAQRRGHQAQPQPVAGGRQLGAQAGHCGQRARRAAGVGVHAEMPREPAQRLLQVGPPFLGNGDIARQERMGAQLRRVVLHHARALRRIADHRDEPQRLQVRRLEIGTDAPIIELTRIVRRRREPQAEAPAFLEHLHLGRVGLELHEALRRVRERNERMAHERDDRHRPVELEDARVPAALADRTRDLRIPRRQRRVVGDLRQARCSGLAPATRALLLVHGHDVAHPAFGRAFHHPQKSPRRGIRRRGRCIAL